MKNKLFCVLLTYKDLRVDDDTIRCEHGLIVAADEEAARLTAVESCVDAHRGEVLFGSDAAEVTEGDLERLIEAMKKEPRDVDACIVSSYKAKT